MIFLQHMFPIPHAMKLTTGPLLSHTNPIFVLTPYFFNIYINVTFPYLPVTFTLFLFF